MKELIKLLQRTLPENIQISLTYGEGSYLMQADPSRIQQVIMNLALNARDVMPGGGQLRFDLSYLKSEKDKPLYMHNMPPGNWIQVEISDTGKGMPSDELQHIFEPFFTTKEVGQGTGLGLAQVYGIVRQHDGYIDVKTVVGQGSTFILYFPTEDTGEKLATAIDMPVLKEGRGETVLVVEDNAATLQALVDSLTLLNYRVLEATNGREALAILESRADEISAVLSDLVMPEMGGIALLQAMQEKKLVIPTIILTGHPLSQDIENSLKPGPTGWLVKPPDLVSLSNMLAQVLAA
jgi:CheY-like chemotaxis protein